jgi:hypothetical protein
MSQGFDCPVGCGGLWTTREHRDEHIRRCHPERVKVPLTCPTCLHGLGFHCDQCWPAPKTLFDLMGI